MSTRPNRRNGRVTNGAINAITALVMASAAGGNTGGPLESRTRRTTSLGSPVTIAATTNEIARASTAAPNPSTTRGQRRRNAQITSDVTDQPAASQNPLSHSTLKNPGNDRSTSDAAWSRSAPISDSTAAVTTSTTYPTARSRSTGRLARGSDGAEANNCTAPAA